MAIKLLHCSLEVGAGLELDESRNDHVSGVCPLCPLLHTNQESLTLCPLGHVLFPYTRPPAVQNFGQSLSDPVASCQGNEPISLRMANTHLPASAGL